MTARIFMNFFFHENCLTTGQVNEEKEDKNYFQSIPEHNKRKRPINRCQCLLSIFPFHREDL